MTVRRRMLAATISALLVACSVGEPSGTSGFSGSSAQQSASDTAPQVTSASGGTDGGTDGGADTGGDAVCGDGVRQGAELCDGTDLNDKTCQHLGLAGGVLACSDACTFDTSACGQSGPSCGDGVLDDDEQCDGDELDGKSCEAFGFSGGTISCTETCSFDISQCTSAPGEQPASGLYAPCSEGMTDACEPPPWSGCMFLNGDGFCTGMCTSADECDLGLDGTATPTCVYSQDAGYNLCALDCADGKSCPPPMVCNNIMSALVGEYCI